MWGSGARVFAPSYGIFRHHNNYWQPVLQDYAMRILWMVPVYSVTCWIELLLMFKNQLKYTYIPEAFRQCFEAYTIYNFFSYMTTFLEVQYGMSAAGAHLQQSEHLLSQLESGLTNLVVALEEPPPEATHAPTLSRGASSRSRRSAPPSAGQPDGQGLEDEMRALEERIS